MFEPSAVESLPQQPMVECHAPFPDNMWTERLWLRPLLLSDALAIFARVSTDPDITRYLTWTPHTSILETLDFIRKCQDGHEGEPTYFWTVVSNDNGRFVGLASCVVQDKSVQIGYLVDSRHWGKGYATEAAGALVEWSATLDGIDTVSAVCDVENAASIAVLSKLGFVCRGILRDALVFPNLDPAPRSAFWYELELQRYC